MHDGGNGNQPVAGDVVAFEVRQLVHDNQANLSLAALGQHVRW